MRTLNYSRLMALNPTKYHSIVNQLGQNIDLYEHPLQGDEHPVIAVLHSEKVAFVTDFYDTEDFFENSDYNPIYIHGEMVSAYEVELN